jgi:hypothetical protein
MMLLRSGPSSTRPRRLHLAIPIAIALVVAAATAAAAATWTKVASPNRGTVASVLQDVTTVPGSAVAWAVGYSYDSNVAAYRTLVERYNGTSWSIVASPSGSANGYSQLNRVDATAANNVWAVGYDTQSGNLVERYNGTSWSKLTTPTGVSLRGIDVVGTNEAWFAGYTGSSAAVVHYLNGQWSTPFTLSGTGRHLLVLEAVTVAPDGDVWAVGWDRNYDAPGRPVSSLVVRGHNGSWARAQSPSPANRNTLYDVVAPAGGDVFAVGVGQTVTGSAITPRSLMLRLHAGKWSELNVPPGEAGSTDQLLSVAAVSPGSLYATGYYSSPSSGMFEPLLVHWTDNANGGAFTLDHPTPPLTVSATAQGVSATPTGTLWAVGYTLSGANTTFTLRGTGG